MQSNAIKGKQIDSENVSNRSSSQFIDLMRSPSIAHCVLEYKRIDRRVTFFILKMHLFAILIALTACTFAQAPVCDVNAGQAYDYRMNLKDLTLSICRPLTFTGGSMHVTGAYNVRFVGHAACHCSGSRLDLRIRTAQSTIQICLLARYTFLPVSVLNIDDRPVMRMESSIVS
jgi:hypothetical protein